MLAPPRSRLKAHIVGFRNVGLPQHAATHEIFEWPELVCFCKLEMGLNHFYYGFSTAPFGMSLLKY